MSGTHESSAWVRDMFGRVAPRYDLLNHLLSFNIDRRWRARTVRRVAGVLGQPGARVLDLCCGTGDLAIALAQAGRARVFGSDFCHPMLVAARRKARGPRLLEADALALPVPDGELDLITIAFGFRNLTDYGAGLREFSRALRPGGMLAILEFSQPPNPLFRAAYDFYSRKILPRLGGAISGTPEAYEYLPESVARFPGAEGLAEMMRSAGYDAVEFERMTFGVVALHTGIRAR